MSEARRPTETWIKRLPQGEGIKTGEKLPLKIELFPIYFWASSWEPGSRLFSPRLPLQSSARVDYWQTRFRVRVNGKWVRTRAKYESFTKDQIFEGFFK